MKRTWYTLLVACVASAVVCGVGPPATMALAANTIEPASMGGANLISYADSDFESSVGNWVSVSNAALSQDKSHQRLHGASLQDLLGSTADSQFKLGNAMQINVTANKKYRIGAYFKAPAASGTTVTWTLGVYNSSGQWQGWTTAQDGSTPITLDNSGNWQYASDVIKMPSSAAYVLGSPQVTYSGGTSGDALYMDEVQFNPYRAATLIGGDGGSDGDAGPWTTANNTIGPLQTDKIFYNPAAGRPLPSTFPGSTCDSLPANVVCLITYKPIDPTNYTTIDPTVTSFVRSIPSDRTVIMIYYNEPENINNNISGSTFVTEYEHEVGVVRQAANDAPNVFTAMAAMAYEYRNPSPGDPGGDARNCSYIPPPQYTDFYLIDAYQAMTTGKDLANETTGEWNNWLSCVSGYNKPIGLAEYGLGTQTSSCINGGTREESMVADDAYLESLAGSSTINAPVIMWEYWWADDSAKTGDPCKNWKFTDSTTINNWQSIEAGP